MINKLALKRAVQKAIEINPTKFTFVGEGSNNFGEPDASKQSEVKITGIFVDEESYTTLNVGDSGQVQKVFSPMLICLWDDSCKDIKKDDTVLVNGVTYKVLAVTNLMQLNVIAEISLEVA